MKRFKTIPKFDNEDKERDFWAKADTSQYFDWSKAKRVRFPNLKLSKVYLDQSVKKDLATS